MYHGGSYHDKDMENTGVCHFLVWFQSIRTHGGVSDDWLFHEER